MTGLVCDLFGQTYAMNGCEQVIDFPLPTFSVTLVSLKAVRARHTVCSDVTLLTEWVAFSIGYQYKTLKVLYSQHRHSYEFYKNGYYFDHC